MSLLTEQEIACPHCKHPNPAEVWTIINVKEDPELKDLLLGGELNMVECEACKKVYYAEHFLIYHDPDRELMAFVYPHGHREERGTWEQKTAADFELSQATLPSADQLRYGPLTLFGMDDLVATVERDDEEKLQGEIVALLADQNHFPIRRFTPAAARAKGFPEIVPFTPSSGASDRAALVVSLAALERINDRLFVYTELRRRLESETGTFAFPSTAPVASA